MALTIFITGASSGIGKTTAKLFQSQGWNVVATMRNPRKETELNQLPHVLITQLDVTDQSSIRDSVEQAVNHFGNIDVLLNNAGYAAYGPLEAASKQSLHREFHVNILGVLLVTREILPYLRKNKSGIIINVSSRCGKVGFPLGSLYHATKFAIEGFSESLSQELAPLGIQVKIIEPGAVNTDFSGRSYDFFNDPDINEYQDIVEHFIATTHSSQRYIAPPSLVAQTILTAATEKSTQLRYPVGEDSQQILTLRQKATDEELMRAIAHNFGIDD